MKDLYNIFEGSRWKQKKAFEDQDFTMKCLLAVAWSIGILAFIWIILVIINI